MRDIRFRGKTTSKSKGEFNNVWVQGDLIVSGGKTYIHPRGNSVNVNGELGKLIVMHECIKESIGQCTGLVDKNLNVIFEGDIIQMNDNLADIAQVIFCEFGVMDIELESATDKAVGWCYKPLYTDAVSAVEPFCFPFQLNNFWIKQLGITVIGNACDNPELLKGKSNA